MSYWKSFGLATFAVVCLLGEATASETTGCYLQGCATEWSGGEIINLGALPGYSQSIAGGINNAGQAVGISYSNLAISATEWSGGKVINLGLGGANAINDVGQVVGESNGAMGGVSATEWSGGSVIDLGGLPGSLNSAAYGINDTGEAVGYSIVGGVQYAVEWSNGSIINLEGLPGFTSSSASGINSAGQVVGDSVVGGVAYATEWNGGTVINLGPGSASGINDLGQVVGSGPGGATEWSNGSVVNLGNLPGALGSVGSAINDAGQAAGDTYYDLDGSSIATEWSGDSVIDLGLLPGSSRSFVYGINYSGQVVGESTGFPFVVPESSTWAMMLAGFAGLAFAGYRRAKAGDATFARDASAVG